MLRLSLIGALLVAMLAAVPAGAAAQQEQQLGSIELEELEAHQQADANYTRDVGAGLTLGGIGVTALGVGLMFRPAGFEDWSGLIVGGLFEGIGGLLALIGIPTWIVGGVRSDVLSRPDTERGRVAQSYELAGIVTTLTSIAMSLAGVALLSAAWIGGPRSRTFSDDQMYRDAGTAGVVLLPVGYFLGTFIGAPLWGEGARF